MPASDTLSLAELILATSVQDEPSKVSALTVFPPGAFPANAIPAVVVPAEP